MRALTGTQPDPSADAFFAGDYRPNWSPDQYSLAFVTNFAWRQPFPNPGGWDVVNVLDLATMTVHPLGPGDWPTWSRDGRLAWSRRDSNGGPAGFVLDGHVFTGRRWKPSWSPDGRMVVYEQLLRGGWAVVVMHSDGGTSRRIGWGRDPRWSPDGRSIASWRAGGLELISPDGRRVRRAALSVGAGDETDWPVWSPNSKYVTVGLTIFTLGTGKEHEMPVGQAGVTTPSWSPDSRWLVYGNIQTPLQLVRPDGTGRHDVNPCATTTP